MTRFLCPECPDHPLLDDTLYCMFCEGQYEWVSKKNKEVKYD